MWKVERGRPERRRDVWKVERGRWKGDSPAHEHGCRAYAAHGAQGLALRRAAAPCARAAHWRARAIARQVRRGGPLQGPPMDSLATSATRESRQSRQRENLDNLGNERISIISTQARRALGVAGQVRRGGPGLHIKPTRAGRGGGGGGWGASDSAVGCGCGCGLRQLLPLLLLRANANTHAHARITHARTHARTDALTHSRRHARARARTYPHARTHPDAPAARRSTGWAGRARAALQSRAGGALRWNDHALFGG